MSSTAPEFDVDRRPFVIDGQLHAAPGHATGEELLAMMQAAGVDAALLTQFSSLGSDNSFILSIVAANPTRFGAVGIVDPAQAAVGEQLARWKRQPGAVAVRIAIRGEGDLARLHSGWYDGLLEAADQSDVPVFMFCPSDLGAVRAIAIRHSRLRLVVDHLGLPTLRHEAGPHVFERLGDVLALAECENIALKLSAAPVHSAQDYPFADLWPHLERVFEAFGLARVMWGSDINRIGGMPFPYAEALAYVEQTPRLSLDEKRLLLGDSLRRWVRWSPVGAPALGI
jgi:L-fuconolactonase